MNTRKMIALLLSVVLALSLLAGCASGAPAKEETASDLTVALVVAGTFGDRSFYDSSKAGCDRLAAEGIQVKTIECKNENHTQQIYNAADAADDYKADQKSGSYNPYVLLYPEDHGFDNGIPEHIKLSLRLSLTKLADAVEKLPFLGDATLENIIKNTVYLGLPDRIERLGKPKNKKQDQLPGGNHDRSL